MKYPLTSFRDIFCINRLYPIFIKNKILRFALAYISNWATRMAIIKLTKTILLILPKKVIAGFDSGGYINYTVRTV